MRRNVVLPQPEGPTTEMKSPRSTATSIACSACNSPKALPRLRICSFAAMSGS
jgi:hypothetical protein